jgi:hypothetical protein
VSGEREPGCNRKRLLRDWFPDEEKMVAHNFYFGETVFLNMLKSSDFQCDFITNTGQHRWYTLSHAAGSQPERG